MGSSVETPQEPLSEASCRSKGAAVRGPSPSTPAQTRVKASCVPSRPPPTVPGAAGAAGGAEAAGLDREVQAATRGRRRRRARGAARRQTAGLGPPLTPGNPSPAGRGRGGAGPPARDSGPQGRRGRTRASLAAPPAPLPRGAASARPRGGPRRTPWCFAARARPQRRAEHWERSTCSSLRPHPRWTLDGLNCCPALPMRGSHL